MHGIMAEGPLVLISFGALEARTHRSEPDASSVWNVALRYPCFRIRTTADQTGQYAAFIA